MANKNTVSHHSCLRIIVHNSAKTTDSPNTHPIAVQISGPPGLHRALILYPPNSRQTSHQAPTSPPHTPIETLPFPTPPPSIPEHAQSVPGTAVERRVPPQRAPKPRHNIRGEAAAKPPQPQSRTSNWGEVPAKSSQTFPLSLDVSFDERPGRQKPKKKRKD